MVDSNDRERVQESADELQKMVDTQHPWAWGQNKLCGGVEVWELPTGIRGQECDFFLWGYNMLCLSVGIGQNFFMPLHLSLEVGRERW